MLPIIMFHIILTSVTAYLNNINGKEDSSSVCLSLLKQIYELKQFEYRVVRGIFGHKEAEPTWRMVEI
jgi:hypothetical protein